MKITRKQLRQLINEAMYDPMHGIKSLEEPYRGKIMSVLDDPDASPEVRTQFHQLADTVTDYNNDGWITAKCKETENIEHAKFDTLNLADVNNFKIHKFYSGEGKIKLGSNKLNPLGNIPLLKIKNAAFQIDSWILGDSLIIHNYTLY